MKEYKRASLAVDFVIQVDAIYFGVLSG